MKNTLTTLRKALAEQDKEKRTIMTIYVVFFLSFIVTLIPVNIISLFSFMICVCTLAAIYSVKSNSEEDSFSENHMSYLISTFWRANLYFFIAAMFAALYIGIFTNYHTLKPCMGYIDDYLMSAIRKLDFSRLPSILRTCEKPFMESNKITFIVTAFIAFSPALFYIAYRCFKGWAYFIKNEMIPGVRP